MPITSLSSRGQVVIPKPIRAAHKWRSGQKLAVIDTGGGVLLKPVEPFPQTSLEEVAGCLKYSGPAKTLTEMEDAIRKGAEETGM